MLGCIGETLDANNQICGAVVSSRGKKSKITLWTRDSLQAKDVLAIGQNFKKLLELPKDLKLEYTPHAKKGGNNGKYNV